MSCFVIFPGEGALVLPEVVDHETSCAQAQPVGNWFAEQDARRPQKYRTRNHADDINGAHTRECEYEGSAFLADSL